MARASSDETARADHSCTIIKDPVSGNKKLVVAGGTIEGSPGTKSVEIFDFESYADKKKDWYDGPDLPIENTLSQLIPDGLQGGCLLVGGRIFKESIAWRSNSIFHISSELQEWKQLKRELSTGRESHIAMLIPDNFLNCIT